jgi:hypothetical protein
MRLDLRRKRPVVRKRPVLCRQASEQDHREKDLAHTRPFYLQPAEGSPIDGSLDSLTPDRLAPAAFDNDQ